jgi:hypothetical protein
MSRIHLSATLPTPKLDLFYLDDLPHVDRRRRRRRPPASRVAIAGPMTGSTATADRLGNSPGADGRLVAN